MAKTYQTLLLTESARIATVSLNRPELRNSFQPGMIRELTDVFQALNARHDLSAVILRGEGKSFCSGADLGYMKSMASFSLEENERDSDQLFEMFWTLRACPHPLLARVHGHVMGGGLGLLAICDIAAAVDGTQFCFSEVRLGLAPAVISPFVLERMQASFARRLMLTGEVFNSDDALSSGLVQFVSSETAVDGFVAGIAKTLTQNGPEAVRATKKLLREVPATDDWSKRRALTTQVIAERRVSKEGQEGLASYFEKRAPKW